VDCEDADPRGVGVVNDGVRVVRDVHGQHFVSVTAAMRLVKMLLGEELDSYGPEALNRIHQVEGIACHAVCLDYCAWRLKLLPEFTPPVWDRTVHPDQCRFQNVIQMALAGFMEFLEQYQVRPITVEQEAVSVPYGLIGHIDLLCSLLWQGRRVKAIVDLKFVSHLLMTHHLQVRLYSKLAGVTAQLGLLYHGNRETGSWAVKPVDLTIGQDDVLAVSYAARLYSWAAQKGRG